MALDQKLLVMFSLLFLGYMMIIYLRQSVSFAAQVIIETEKIQNSDIGLIVSCQMVGYTVMKFLGGSLVDVLDPGLTFVASLFFSGIIGFTFTAFSSTPVFSFLWFLNGVVLGPSWSACGLLMKKNLQADQLATWWSVLSVSSNVAGTFGPFLSTSIINMYSWRASFIFGATMNIVLAVVCGIFFFNSPSTRQKKEQKKETDDKKPSLTELFSPVMLSLCANYLLVSVVRGSSNDWGQLYLIQTKGHSLQTGSTFISIQEIGGIAGSCVAGYASDVLISKKPGNVRPRLLFILLLTILQTVGLFFFIFHVSAQSSKVWINSLSFIVGFGMYGAIALLGVTSMEVAPDKLTGTAHSMASLGGNIGRIMAGYPLSVVSTWRSWNESFMVVLFFSVQSVVVSALSIKFLNERSMKGSKDKMKSS